MEQQKEILQRSDDTSVVAGHPSVAAARDDRRRLLVNALLLAAMIPALLRCSSGGDLLPAAWNHSLFAVCYLFYCVCSLSNSSTPLANIFVTLFYVGLLMYLDSVLAAGLFGKTLAQHRQSNGTETATLLVAVANARPRANAKKPKNRRSAYGMIGFMGLCG